MTRSGQGTVLVESANESERNRLVALLGKAGYSVIPGENGGDVPALAAASQPDAILLDAETAPSVVEICRRLNKEPGTAALSILALGSFSSRDERLSALRCGVDDLVPKPFDDEELVLRVHSAVVRTRLARHLREDAVRIRDLETARDELTQLIVKEMKTPLTGLADLLELADRASVKHFKAEASEFVNDALGATETLEELVDFLLDVRRMLAGTVPLTKSECPLLGLAHTTADLLGEAAQAKSVSLDVGGTAVTVACDVPMVTRVLRHLLRSAIDLAAGGNAVRVVVSEDAGGGGRIAVSGSGSMTDPGDGSARRGGGLGLTFCRLVAEAHGGRFGVEHDEGMKTSWWVSLPRGTADAGAAPPTAASTETDAPKAKHQRSRRYLGAGRTSKPAPRPSASLVARNTRHQFAVAVALMSAIPILAFSYILADAIGNDSFSYRTLVLMSPSVVALVSMGVVLLLRHTMEVTRLRQYLEVMARGGVPQVSLGAGSEDFAAIEQHLGAMIKQTDERIRIIESQSKALVQAEQQRVMVETVGAACHHLGQPATVIAVYLDLMRRKESSPEIRSMIEECQSAASDVSSILHRLQGVTQYQTEPYLPMREPGVVRSDERILKI